MLLTTERKVPSTFTRNRNTIFCTWESLHDSVLVQTQICPQQRRYAALKKKPWTAFPKLILRYRLYEETWYIHIQSSWSQRPHGLRRGSVAVRLLGLKVSIPPGAWMSVSCECCVLWGTGLCDGPIPCTEKSYWFACACVCVCIIACNRVKQ